MILNQFQQCRKKKYPPQTINIFLFISKLEVYTKENTFTKIIHNMTHIPHINQYLEARTIIIKPCLTESPENV